MMGVLNFAHAGIYMIGAYLAFESSRLIGFWAALIIAPLVCGAIGAAIEIYGLRRAHQNGHIAELLFTFGLFFIIERGVQMAWGMLPVPYRVPAGLDFPLFSHYGINFPAYRAFMLLVAGGMLLGDLAAADAHPHRPDHPGIVDASQHGQRARPQRAAGLYDRICRRLFSCRSRRRDRR